MPVSDTVIAAVVGGVNRVVIAHVLRTTTSPLTAVGPDLIRFITLSLASRSESQVPVSVSSVWNPACGSAALQGRRRSR